MTVEAGEDTASTVSPTFPLSFLTVFTENQIRRSALYNAAFMSSRFVHDKLRLAQIIPASGASVFGFVNAMIDLTPFSDVIHRPPSNERFMYTFVPSANTESKMLARPTLNFLKIF
jgi:hypothetical protein